MRSSETSSSQETPNAQNYYVVSRYVNRQILQVINIFVYFAKIWIPFEFAVDSMLRVHYSPARQIQTLQPAKEIESTSLILQVIKSFVYF